MAEDSEPRESDSAAQASAEGKKQPAGGSQELSRDSLLELFKNTDVEENQISLLSRDLADVSIESLLEQSRRIVKQIRAR